MAVTAVVQLYSGSIGTFAATGGLLSAAALHACASLQVHSLRTTAGTPQPWHAAPDTYV